MNDLIKKAFPFVENMQINKKIKGKIHCIENKEVELEYMKNIKIYQLNSWKIFIMIHLKLKINLKTRQNECS